jgi:hypothetical protein
VIVKPPTPPVHLARLEFLHGELWAQGDSVYDILFSYFDFPLFNTEADSKTDTDTDTDTNQQGMRRMWAAEKLSLNGIATGAQRRLDGCLPCGARELLVRGAYREVYDILVSIQKHRQYNIEHAAPMYDEMKCSLIIGPPGTGKTWFLTYVLIRRLLEGKPTIFQVAKRSVGALEFTDATHYLINGKGVHPLPHSPSFSQLNDPEIWVLADQKLVGVARNTNNSWMVVVTCSPLEENYPDIANRYPNKLILPVWEWEEIVAAAYVCLPLDRDVDGWQLSWLAQSTC